MLYVQDSLINSFITILDVCYHIYTLYTERKTGLHRLICCVFGLFENEFTFISQTDSLSLIRSYSLTYNHIHTHVLRQEIAIQINNDNEPMALLMQWHKRETWYTMNGSVYCNIILMYVRNYNCLNILCYCNVIEMSLKLLNFNFTCTVDSVSWIPIQQAT